MISDLATRALKAANQTRALEISQGALAQVPRIFNEQFAGSIPAIITDANTFRAAGQQVLCAFDDTPEKFIFEDLDLYAEYSYFEQLEAFLKSRDVIPIAVGSGTMNDLVKLAAHRVNRPYLCVATAASMDGYTAFGASITHKGDKKTFDCPAPRAVVADLDVLCKAPPAMSASGYADLAAKITAGADWILADALGVEPINPVAWDLVQSNLRSWLANPQGLRTGDIDCVRNLTEGLMLSGFAMQWTKTSRPASGAEHQFSHLWDMQHHTHNGAAPSHGFKVGIATLAVTRLYEQLLSIENIDVERAVEAWPGWSEQEQFIIRSLATPEIVQKALSETRAKWLEKPALRDQLTKLKSVWPDLKIRLRQQLIPSAELQQMFTAAGAPTDPGEIGISPDRLRRSIVQAYHIRRRFTVLDLTIRANISDRLFSSV